MSNYSPRLPITPWRSRSIFSGLHLMNRFIACVLYALMPLRAAVVAKPSSSPIGCRKRFQCGRAVVSVNLAPWLLGCLQRTLSTASFSHRALDPLRAPNATSCSAVDDVHLLLPSRDSWAPSNCLQVVPVGRKQFDLVLRILRAPRAVPRAVFAPIRSAAFSHCLRCRQPVPGIIRLLPCIAPLSHAPLAESMGCFSTSASRPRTRNASSHPCHAVPGKRLT